MSTIKWNAVEVAVKMMNNSTVSHTVVCPKGKRNKKRAVKHVQIKADILAKVAMLVILTPVMQEMERKMDLIKRTREATKVAFNTLRQEGDIKNWEARIMAAATQDEDVCDKLSQAVRIEIKNKVIWMYKTNGSYMVINKDIINSGVIAAGWEARKMDFQNKQVRATKIVSVLRAGKRTIMNKSLKELNSMIASFGWENNLTFGKAKTKFINNYVVASNWVAGNDKAYAQILEEETEAYEQTKVATDDDMGLSCPINRSQINRKFESKHAEDVSLAQIAREEKRLANYVRKDTVKSYKFGFNKEEAMVMAPKWANYNKKYSNLLHKVVVGSTVIEDVTNPTGYCYNFDCSSRQLNEAVQLQEDKKAANLIQIHTNEAIMRRGFANLTAKYGARMMFKDQMRIDSPVVREYKYSTDVAKIEITSGRGLAKYARAMNVNKTMADMCPTIKDADLSRAHKVAAALRVDRTIDDTYSTEILKAGFMLPYYKSGDVNWNVKRTFISRLGDDAGRAMFDKYAKDVLEYDALKTATWALVNENKELTADINDLKSYWHGYENGVKGDLKAEYRNGAALVHVDYISLENGTEVAVCPHCGEVVYIENQVAKGTTYNVTKNDVRDEVDFAQSYTFDDGRTVVINSNGELVSDSVNDVKSYEEAVADMEDSEESIFSPANVDHAISEYKQSIVTGDDMQEFYADAGDYTEEEVEEYNSIMKAHKGEYQWSKLRGAVSLEEAGAVLATKLDGKVKPAGYSVHLLRYEADLKGYDKQAITDKYESILEMVKAFDSISIDDVDDMVDSIMSMECYTDYVTHDRTHAHMDNCSKEILAQHWWSNDDRLLAGAYAELGLEYVKTNSMIS
jgi:hypothetical protein